MKKVGSGGLPPTLQNLIKDASQSGKPIGAPKLNKALNGLGLHLGQLKKADQQTLRDVFEHAPLTSKARALAEKLLQGKGGLVKVKMDEPATNTPPPIGTRPEVVKVKMDEPAVVTPPISTKPEVVKVKMDEPATNTPPPISTRPQVVKVKMDEPTGF
jgi:hypothetical protein